MLEVLLPLSVDFYAYAGGPYNKAALSELRSGGYRGACSCIQGYNHVDTPAYLLRRLEIRRSMGLDDFKRLFDPNWVLFYRLIDVWKAGLKQAVGLERYSRIRSGLYKFYFFKR